MTVDLYRNAFCLLGVPFDKLDMQATISRIRDAVAHRTPLTIATPNLNFIIGCREDFEFRNAVINCDLSVIDGMPPVWIMRLLGIPIRERVAGSNLFEALRNDTSAPMSVYFFGGEDGVAEIASRTLNAERSGFTCVGYESPGFGSIEAMSSDETIAKINASGADFLVVALGAKKGHAWIERNRDRISVPVISHLGAVLNFVAGNLKRAPRWMQVSGLEWLWRIKEEPALWSRYFHDGRILLFLFVTRILPLAIYVKYNWPAAGEVANLTVKETDQYCEFRLFGPWTYQNLAFLRDCFSGAVKAGKDVRLNMAGVTYCGALFWRSSYCCMSIKGCMAGNWW